MRRTLLAALSLLLVGAWSQPAQAQVPDELADLIPSWAEAFNAGDGAAVASHYTEDARRIPPLGDIQLLPCLPFPFFCLSAITTVPSFSPFSASLYAVSLVESRDS